MLIEGYREEAIEIFKAVYLEVHGREYVSRKGLPWLSDESAVGDIYDGSENFEIAVSRASNKVGIALHPWETFLSAAVRLREARAKGNEVGPA
jgi:hypothetical protein